MRSLRARWPRVRHGCAHTARATAPPRMHAQGWSSLRRTFPRSGSRTTRTHPRNGNAQQGNHMHQTACAHATGSDARRTACCEGGPSCRTPERGARSRRHRPRSTQHATWHILQAGACCFVLTAGPRTPTCSALRSRTRSRRTPPPRPARHTCSSRGRRWTPCCAYLPRSVQHAVSRAPSAACCAAEMVRWRTLVRVLTLGALQVPRDARWHRRLLQPRVRYI